MNYVFIVLHYLVPDITMSSVDQLLSAFKGKDISVIIVDNASPDESGKIIQTRYEHDHRVHVIQKKSNEGFARGNNEGYRYAVKHLSPDFIIVMNNDVLVKDNDFLDRIEAEYNSSPFAVLGPDIFCPGTGIHQNPSRLQPLSYDDVARIADKARRFSVWRYFGWELKTRLGLVHQKPEEQPENGFGKARTGCVLHGACYIFSMDFISRREYAFNPATFLYMEEDILYYECSRDGLVMRYSPSLSVLHMEDAATKSAYKTDFCRSRMKSARIADSACILSDLMKR